MPLDRIRVTVNLNDRQIKSCTCNLTGEQSEVEPTSYADDLEGG